jgi:uncharacterized protein (TIGR03083 family)
MGQTVAVRSDLWRVIHAERAALVDDLFGFDPAQWATPSLCDGWDVHDVVTHLAATATLSLPGFAKEFLLAGFSSARIVDKQVAAGRRREPSETLSALRSAISSTASPPQPTITRIIEIIVHGEDIRRPLYISHEYSTIHIAEALDYLTRDGSSGAKVRLAGLRLHATDIDTDTNVGTGQLVEGPAVPLLLAVSGRSVALPDLSAPGEQTLSDRLRPTTPP